MVKVFAPAKINYHLHVLEKRPDFYHNLDSLIGFLNIGDEIEITDSSHFFYHATGRFSSHLPENQEDDLVVKAARLFSSHVDMPLTLSIHLTKNLPSGAGLGGGSSDAAAVLLGLNQYFKTNLCEEALCTLGLKLGSELPVCVRRRLTYVSGRGGILKEPKESVQERSVLVVWPDIVCSTEKIFKSYQPLSSHEENDLTPTACRLYPEIKTCLEALKAQDGCIKAQMNGSGSSCFAFFKTHTQMKEAQEALLKAYPHWWIRLTSNTF